MVDEDKAFVQKCLAAGVINSPCLELGGQYASYASLFPHIENYITDIAPAPGVDYVADFENDEAVSAAFSLRFSTALVFNVLEHTFEPVRVLDNVFSLLTPGGSCIISTPVIWPLHDAPKDFCRLNPQWYEEYAMRRGLVLRDDLFEYLNDKSIRIGHPQYQLPPPSTAGRRAWSRAIHRLFNTDGRGIEFPSHIQLGAVMLKP